MEKIVVGVDDSEHAAAALAWAYDEAVLWGAEVVVVHAWTYPYRGLRGGSTSATDAMREDAERVLLGAIEAVRRDKGEQVVLKPALVEAGAARAVLDQAADADLIVVGSRGRGGFTSMLLGSVSHTIVQHASCPVAVIHVGR
jgi:nucleotide-binding universal stress UspA family protein